MASKQLSRGAFTAADVLSVIEKGTKAAVGILGVLAVMASLFYATGFVIVNLHLLSYGIKDVRLDRPVYLPAGIGFVLANSLPFFLALSLSLLARVLDGKLDLKKHTRNYIISLVVLACATFIVSSAMQEKLLGMMVDPPTWSKSQLHVSKGDATVHSYPSQSKKTVINYNEVTAYIKKIAAVTALTAIVIFMLPADRREFERYWPLSSSLMLALFFAAILYMAIWGVNVYPRLSSALGGGRPVRISLVAADESAERTLKLSGLTSSMQITAPVYLLDEAETRITVLLENTSEMNQHAVSLDKRLILNVLYLPESGR